MKIADRLDAADRLDMLNLEDPSADAGERLSMLCGALIGGHYGEWTVEECKWVRDVLRGLLLFEDNAPE